MEKFKVEWHHQVGSVGVTVQWEFKEMGVGGKWEGRKDGSEGGGKQKMPIVGVLEQDSMFAVSLSSDGKGWRADPNTSLFSTWFM